MASCWSTRWCTATSGACSSRRGGRSGCPTCPRWSSPTVRIGPRALWWASTTTGTRPITGTWWRGLPGWCSTTCGSVRPHSGRPWSWTRGVYIPPGVAHGFAAVTDLTLTYLVDGYYDPADELGVAWDDPSIGADWGVVQPVLSARDLANPACADLVEDLRPVFGER